MEIGFRLGSLGTIQQCTTELLDRDPVAVLLLNEKRRVVYANRSAEALRSGGDGIRLSPDGITALRKQDDDRLHRLIEQALFPVLPEACHGGIMRVLRPSGKHPYAVLVAPVAKRFPALSALRPAVCVTITDPDSQKPLASSRLQAAFGLTEAEARLAALLAAGEDLRSAADKLFITYGTARVRLAEVFQKTATRRQGELIQLLLTTLTML